MSLSARKPSFWRSRKLIGAPNLASPIATSESSAALRSQRRFLILVSIAVAAYYALVVHLKGEGEYSGFAVIIGRPDRIPIALWLVFTWAVLRYVQRLNEQWATIRELVLKEFEDCDHQLVLNAARRWAVKQAKRGALNKHLKDLRVFGRAWLVDSIKEIIREQAAQRATSRGEEMRTPKPDPWFVTDERGWRIYRGFGIAGQSPDLALATGIDFSLPPWSPLRTRWHQLRAWGRTAWKLPAISEHLAPFAIAIAAIVCAAVFHAPPDRAPAPTCIDAPG